MGRRPSFPKKTNTQQTHEKKLNITNRQRMQIKTTIRHYLTSARIAIGEDVKKRESLCAVGRNVNCCSHYGEQNEGSSKK